TGYSTYGRDGPTTAEATKAARRAGIEHAKQHGDRAYLGRKPSYTRTQLDDVRAMLGQEATGIAMIAKETGLTRQTVYRIKDDPASAEAAWRHGAYSPALLSSKLQGRVIAAPEADRAHGAAGGQKRKSPNSNDYEKSAPMDGK